jgi:hypothetical protein
LEREAEAITLAAATFGAKTYHHWVILNTDPTGKRAACRCRCGTTRIISTAAIEDGTAAESCGCAPITSEQIEALRQEAEQKQRQRELKDWKPGAR